MHRRTIRAVRALTEELAASGGLSADETRRNREYIAASAWRYAATLDRLATAFGRPLRDAAVLDIGAFPGHLAAWLSREEHAHVTAVTLMTSDAFARQMDAAGVAVVTCDVEADAVPAADGTMDIVLCSELIEHLDGDVLHMLREARRVLGDHGMLLLTTPNHASLAHRWALARGRSVYPALDHPDYPFYAGAGVRNPMRHVREFTVHEIAALLAEAGFSRRSVDTASPPLSAGDVLSWRGRLINRIVRYAQPLVANSGTLIIATARP
jgi:SAM-dependent methyltransferase